MWDLTINFIKRKNDLYVSITLNHIIYDFRSITQVFAKDLLSILQGQKLPELKYDYSSYVKKEKKWLEKNKEKAKNFYQEYLKGSERFYQFLKDSKLHDLKPRKLYKQSIELDKDLVIKLNEFAKKHDVSVQNILYVAYFYTLSDIYKIDDVVVQTPFLFPINGNDREVLGFFCTQDIPIYLSKNNYFIDNCRIIKNNIMNIYNDLLCKPSNNDRSPFVMVIHDDKNGDNSLLYENNYSDYGIICDATILLQVDIREGFVKLQFFANPDCVYEVIDRYLNTLTFKRK